MEEIIKKYLEERAKDDPTIAMNLLKANKTIEGCCRYITEQARKAATNNVAMIEDAMVYNWAIHYYDEDSIEDKPKPQPKAKVMVMSPKTAETKAETETTKFVQMSLF